MAKIFFSYSHKDEALRDQLEVQLAMLKNMGLIETWHDRCIKPGDNLNNAIDSNLSSADIVLLLVSPDFLASQYCWDVEVKRAMERHDREEARVIAVILRPCHWEAAPFAKLLVAPTDGKPVTTWGNTDAAFLNVAEAIKRALPHAQRGAPAAPRPAGEARVAVLAASPPRSSNLRVRRDFTDHDKDDYIAATFEYMCQYFENSVAELRARHPNLTGRFERIDANTFTVVIYRDGRHASACRVFKRLKGGFGRGIYYSSELQPQLESMNESLAVEHDSQKLYLRSSGMSGWGAPREARSLNDEGAAEFFWSILILPLQ
jgi:hypothetical protein